MDATKAWAAVWSLGGGIDNFPSPHSAAAAAVQDDVLFCSCVLPWRSARGWWPDEGEDLAVIMATTLAQLAEGFSSVDLSIVWGGDWNQSLEGHCVGTRHGRRATEQLVDQLGLRVPTRDLPHASPDLFSIDHIAIPSHWRVTDRQRIVAARRLSDHDAYVVDAETPADCDDSDVGAHPGH